MSDLINRLCRAAFVRFNDGFESKTLAVEAAQELALKETGLKIAMTKIAAYEARIAELEATAHQPQNLSRGQKFVSHTDGKTYIVVSEVAGIVTYDREDLVERHPTRYLGRAEFDKRFQPIADTQMTGALAAIAAERHRQIGKGYDAAHDDSHIGGEIVLSEWGARARIEAAINAGRSGDVAAYKELLTEAAAQCAAEIERVERAEGKAHG